MTISRRSFVGKSAALIAAIPFASNMAFAQENDMLTGLQLYSVREDMKNDPTGTIKSLSQMGYKFVEHAGYSDGKFYGYTPKDFKSFLGDLGMAMPSGHSVFGKNHYANGEFSDSWKRTLDDSATAGIEYVISPWMDKDFYKDLDALKQFMEVFNKCGELAKAAGTSFGYHNHDFEFSVQLDGKALYAHILDNTDPNLVYQQLDFGNMVNGGAQAAEWIAKYPGRFVSTHVKDEIKESPEDEKYESCVLGTGIVGVKDVLDLAKSKGGTIHFIIEQESYQGKTPMACMKENIAIMKNWGYSS